MNRTFGKVLAEEQSHTALRFSFRSHCSFGDPHLSRSITISSTLCIRPLLLLQIVSGNGSQRVCVGCRFLFLPPIFKPTMSLSLPAPTVSFSSTHTGLQRSDSWLQPVCRDFSSRKHTAGRFSTIPMDCRTQAAMLQSSTLSYGKTLGRLKRAYLKPSSKPAPFVETQLSRSIAQPSKDTIPPSSQPLHPTILRTV
nr:hypothetical protein HmN_000587500 [Hymenolepis microstoma]